eukprot:gnl/TRDRNA2_/TRDRNA2_181079_c0_seq1.p1 gnl/TRDRNA2_/TRDRNA2_181079_c0~~gnl/TRDRNA2_/TRDRNA2_181079_c0_seq1.p1  ORF type:complete len:229 (+),score=19.50 gnl/TRDRNA2_/TRDRNA2_181079_c0_seq1:146-832(+)
MPRRAASTSALRENIKITQESVHESAPRWSLGARTPDKRRSDNPGPGRYGVPSNAATSRSTPSFGFGSCPRIKIIKEDSSPGPGSYAPADPNWTTPHYGFGSADRIKKPKSESAPGPGTYEAKKGMKELGKTMAARLDGQSMRHANPGPGAYKPLYDQVWRKDPQWGTTIGNRTEWKGPDAPGPGTYEPLSTLAKMSSPSFSIRKRVKRDLSLGTPGPYGSYTQFYVD